MKAVFTRFSIPFAALFLLNPLLRAQNVGIGTAAPSQKLHIAGNVRTDNALILWPGAFAAAAAPNINLQYSTARITFVAGVQANAVVYSAAATEGQVLFISNEDDNPATFVATTIPAGEARAFTYTNSIWRPTTPNASATAWLTLGNTGTVPATNFLGTIDNQSLVIRTNNVERMRVTNIGNVGIGTAAPITQLHVPGSTPTIELSNIATGTNPYSIFVSDRYAYVTCHTTNSMQIFDMSVPASPVLMSTLATGMSSPRWPYVAGRYAYYVGSWSDQLQIVDVSNPNAPVIMSTVATGDHPCQVYVQGRYAYVPNLYSSTLQIFDINNPAAPVAISSTPVTAQPMYVYVQGRYAYVTSGNGGDRFQIFDVSNPAAPVAMGFVTTNTDPWVVQVQGRYAYVGTDGGNLQVIDVKNPLAPVIISTTAVGVNARGLSIQDRYAYVSSFSTNTIKILDISNPAAPAIIGTINTTIGGNPNNMYVQGRYAYSANWTSNAIQVFDLGGSYIQQMEAGMLEASTISVRMNAQVGNDLDVKGGLTTGNGARITGNIGIYGNGCYTGTWAACSDQRYKTAITPITSALVKVQQLQGVYYDWRTQDFPDMHFSQDRQIGVIAQEVEKLFPELVSTDALGYKSVDYAKITPILIEAIKELSSRNESLEGDVREMNERLKAVESALGQ